MKAFIPGVLVLAGILVSGQATEFHVAVDGDDAAEGTRKAPFRTIQRAADRAHPGDVVTVHEGIYRERVNPPRGGSSNEKRIVYRAPPGEKVEIRGSERVDNWEPVDNGVWKAALPNSFFGDFNPYNDLIQGDWFNPKKRKHHTGAVYLNGDWLIEASSLEEALESNAGDALWFGVAGEDVTTIWAQFGTADPNRENVEINVRQSVFHPDRPGRDFITVRGFTMRHAATPWAPPTAVQIGLLGTHWSRGWIIEDNTISYSVCCGITLGKYGDEWDNTSANSAEGYVQTIDRALKNGWSRERVGGHIVRRNAISHCEQAGIVGSMGGAFSVITDNTIHDIHVRRLFTGAEQAGIKLHGAIDTVVARNYIHHAIRGIWLDWMAQGARVTRNLIHDTDMDLFFEVNHGPFLADNNICLSVKSVQNVSHGGAYAHNLFGGIFFTRKYEKRRTPYHRAHSTELVGLSDNPSGDDRIYNNVFFGQRSSLSDHDQALMPVWMAGNLFFSGARPSRHEAEPVLHPDADPGFRVISEPDGVFLDFNLPEGWMGQGSRALVDSELLGKARIPQLPYVGPDDTPIRVDTDYFGKPRDAKNPAPGPFAKPGTGPQRVKVR